MSSSPIFTLDTSGYFQRRGQRFVPVGVNYWPASCGVEIWPQWPADEIQHDLDVMRKLGLNCIRFFLRWQDFEPEPGQYNEQNFWRLARFVSWCGERGIAAHPSLFVGFMSSGVFWPAWKKDRNVFADPYMVERGAAFARKAAEALRPVGEHVFAIDHGNELACLAEAAAARPSDTRRWCEAINTAIRSVWPEVLIVCGLDQGQFIGDRGFRFGDQPGCDFYSMHGYPVGAWHCLPFDGLTDPLGQSLLPFYTQVARSFGPVMVQEFGSILTYSVDRQEQYLRAVIPACWQAGGNGFLWWCLRDIPAPVHPYVRSGFERLLGLVDAEDRVKPGAEVFLQFARDAETCALPAAPANPVGLYFPKHFYAREDPKNPGNDPRTTARWLSAANYLVRRLGRPTQIVHGSKPLDAAPRTLVIAGAVPDGFELEALEAWVQAGGRLVWHGPLPMQWGHVQTRLLGAHPLDFRAQREVRVQAFNAEWTFSRHPNNVRHELAPDAAEVLARDHLGLPVLLRHRLGQGAVVYALPNVEEEFAALAHDRDARDRWTQWYAGVLEAAAE